MPARMCRPGAVTSGFRKSPPGPRDENDVIASPCQVVFVPWVKLAVAPGWELSQLSRTSVSGLSMCTVGSQRLSVMTSSGVALYRIMPAAPPCLTEKPLSTRFGPRWQATIFPENNPGGAGLRHSGSLYGGADASTTGSGEETPPVIDAPLIDGPPVRVIVDWKVRLCVEAATVVTHGPRWSVVLAPGPELPADAATKTPAAYASRKASSTGSL